jgi:hypothetical protein
MKKTLLIGIIALVVFGACQQPLSDVKLGIDPASIASPSLTAQKAPGGVLITWPPVENASGYQVWRQRAKGVAQKVADLNAADNLRFADVNSITNPLASGVDYKYTVIALSNSATSVGGGNPNVVVQNGKAEKTVNFKADELPASITLSPVTGLALKETLEGSLIASWAADDNPLVSYQVTFNCYFTDDYNQYGYTYTYISSDAYAYDHDPTASNVVSVVKVLGDNYSTAAAGSLLISRYDGGTNLNISAVRDSNTSVKITLPVLAHAELTQYEVSRAKLGFNNQQIIEDWTPVTISGVRKTASGYEFYDSAAAGDYKWSYRLIVKNPAGGAIYGLGYTEVNALPAGSLQSLNLAWKPNTTYSSTASADHDDLQAIGYLQYDIEADVDYTLYRKQASGPNGTALPAGTAYDWELVTIAPADKQTGPDSESVKVTLPQARIKYEFKVVATGKGAKAGYTGTQASTTVSLRSAIIPSNFSYSALSYNLSNWINFTQIGYKFNTSTGVQIGVLYQLNFNQAPNGGQSGDLLRSGESLVVEIRSQDDENSVYTTLTTLTKPAAATYGPADASSAPSNWYFVLPYNATNPVQYDIRLVVNAQ